MSVDPGDLPRWGVPGSGPVLRVGLAAAGTGAAAAAAGAGVWGCPAAGSFGYLAGVGAWLAVLDARSRRLPDVIVVPAVVVCFGLLVAQVRLDGQPGRLGRAALGLLVSVLGYLLVGMLSGGIGGGDVKLAGLAGLMLAWVGWPVLVVGSLGAFALALPVVGVLLVRGAGRAARIPFGPFVLASAALALAGSALS